MTKGLFSLSHLCSAMGQTIDINFWGIISGLHTKGWLLVIIFKFGMEWVLWKDQILDQNALDLAIKVDREKSYCHTLFQGKEGKMIQNFLLCEGRMSCRII